MTRATIRVTALFDKTLFCIRRVPLFPISSACPSGVISSKTNGIFHRV